MTLIDWSDSEGLFGLLVDLVADEKMDCDGDLDRERFLSSLLEQLRALQSRLPGVGITAVIQGLKDLHESVDPEFIGDPATVHLQDCIRELERIGTRE